MKYIDLGPVDTEPTKPLKYVDLGPVESVESAEPSSIERYAGVASPNLTQDLTTLNSLTYNPAIHPSTASLPTNIETPFMPNLAPAPTPLPNATTSQATGQEPSILTTDQGMLNKFGATAKWLVRESMASYVDPLVGIINRIMPLPSGPMPTADEGAYLGLAKDLGIQGLPDDPKQAVALMKERGGMAMTLASFGAQLASTLPIYNALGKIAGLGRGASAGVASKIADDMVVGGVYTGLNHIASGYEGDAKIAAVEGAAAFGVLGAIAHGGPAMLEKVLASEGMEKVQALAQIVKAKRLVGIPLDQPVSKENLQAALGNIARGSKSLRFEDVGKLDRAKTFLEEISGSATPLGKVDSAPAPVVESLGQPPVVGGGEKSKLDISQALPSEPLAQTKVVDSKGIPLVVYHGTSSDTNFSTFQSMSHFGSLKAATEVTKDMVGGEAIGGRIFPVYLDIKNPARVRDMGQYEHHNPSSLAISLEKTGAISSKEAKQIIATNAVDRDGAYEQAQTDLIFLLRSKGYDGLVYKNKVEDPGSTSWVVFDSSQVHSAVGADAALAKGPVLKGKPTDVFPNSTFHTTDDLESIDSILTEGLRPGTHVAYGIGQGTDQAVTFVYQGKPKGVEKAYRPGEIVTSKSLKRPLAIVFDTEGFVKTRELEAIEKEMQRELQGKGKTVNEYTKSKEHMDLVLAQPGKSYTDAVERHNAVWPPKMRWLMKEMNEAFDRDMRYMDMEQKGQVPDKRTSEQVVVDIARKHKVPVYEAVYSETADEKVLTGRVLYDPAVASTTDAVQAKQPWEMTTEALNDTTLYHGGTASGNPSTWEISKDAWFGDGIYITSSDKIASGYAAGDGGHVTAVRVRLNNPFGNRAYTASDSMQITKALADSYKQSIAEFADTNMGRDVSRVTAEGQPQDIMELMAVVGDMDYGTIAGRILRDAGFDAIAVRGGEAELVVFDPKSITVAPAALAKGPAVDRPKFGPEIKASASIPLPTGEPFTFTETRGSQGVYRLMPKGSGITPRTVESGTPGIKVQIAKSSTGERIMPTIYFDTSKFTPEQAGKWMQDNATKLPTIISNAKIGWAVGNAKARTEGRTLQPPAPISPSIQSEFAKAVAKARISEMYPELRDKANELLAIYRTNPNLTDAHVVQMMQDVQSLRHSHDTANMIFVKGRLENLDITKQHILTSVESFPRKIKAKPTEGAKLSIVGRFVESNTDARTAVMPFGPRMHLLVVEDMRIGERTMLTIKHREQDVTKAFLANNGIGKEFGVSTGGRRKTLVPFTTNAGEVIEYTSSERVHLANLLSLPDTRPLIESNGIKLIQSESLATTKWTPTDTVNFMKSLSPKERALSKHLLERYNGELRRDFSHATLHNKGADLASRELYAPRRIAKEERPGGEGTFIRMERTEMEKMGITRPVTDHGYPFLIEDALNVYDRYVHDVGLLAGMAEPVRNLELVLGDVDVTKAIRSVVGDKGLKFYREYVNAAAGVVPVKTDASKFAMRVLNNAASSVMMGRVTSAWKQILGYFSVPFEMDTKYLLKGLRHRNLDISLYTKNSPHYNERYRGGPMYMSGVPSGGSGAYMPKDIGTKISNLPVMGIQRWDRNVYDNVFRAAYHELKATHPEIDLKSKDGIQRIVDRAESVIRDTQNPSSTLDMSQMFIESKHDPLQRVLTMFSSPGMKMFSLLRHDTIMYRQGALPLSTLLYHYTLILGAMPLMDEVITKAWRIATGKALPDELSPKNIVMDMIQNEGQLLPGLPSKAINFFLGMAQGFGITPAEELGGASLRYAGKIGKGVYEGGQAVKALGERPKPVAGDVMSLYEHTVKMKGGRWKGSPKHVILAARAVKDLMEGLGGLTGKPITPVITLMEIITNYAKPMPKVKPKERGY